jgi:hypothetical protein
MRIATVLTMMATSLNAASPASQGVSAALPAPSAVTAPQFTCTEIVSTSISSERGTPQSARAEARQGREVFYMRLMGNVLNLVTKAEASIGEAAGHPMSVTTATSDLVVATAPDTPGSAMSFVVQRKSGYAIWTRTQASTWLGANAPSVQSVYFHCR